MVYISLVKQTIANFSTRRDVSYTSTPNGAVRNCITMAARFAVYCQKQGLRADVIVLAVKLYAFPSIHPYWGKFLGAGSTINHYITRVEDTATTD